MKPRYVVVHEAERDDFEKEYQLPYGYGGLDIYFDLEEAIDEASYYGIGYVVEEVSEDGRQAVYQAVNRAVYQV